jgi:hypothetical protein
MKLVTQQKDPGGAGRADMSRFCHILILNLSFSLLLCTSAYAQPYKLQTYQAGLGRAYNANGVAAADYNNDGLIDIYVVSRLPKSPHHPGSANSLFKNNGDGTFTNVAKEAGVEGIADTIKTIPQNDLVENFGASWGDFDDDGDVDLYVTNKGVDELFENLGDGTFKNITHSAGLDLLIRDSSSAAWFDLDRDGDLDLYVSSYGEHGLPPSSDNVMYRNNGDGTFTDITSATGLGKSVYTYTTLILDADMDGWPDLYCVNDFGDNFFYLNNCDGTFREATQEFGLDNAGEGMGATMGDYDNDGFFDIYHTNVGDDLDFEWSPLFRHSINGTFEDVSRQTGTGITNWAWGCEFLDFDLDGNLDLYVVNGFTSANVYHNRLYRNNGDGTFEDFSAQSGADSQEEARGLCVADFNNDGRLDLAVANLRGTVHLYLNTIRSGNYLKINLIGTQSNRDARGAVVSITANDKTYHRTNDGVEYYGQSKVPVHFGLGNARVVQNIAVLWPSGLQQEFYDIPANRTITITEKSANVTAVKDENAPPPRDFVLLNNYPNPVMRISQTLISQIMATTLYSASTSVGYEAAPIGINKQVVGLRTADNLQLAADLYEPDFRTNQKQQKSPGLALLGPFLESRQLYTGLAEELCRKGMIVLSVDVRNSGDSALGQDFDPTSIANLHLDANAALNFLSSHSAVDSNNLAILGTSITARNALLGAGRKENVNAAVLVSAVLDSAGFDVIRNSPFRPNLMIVSLQDTVAVTQVQDIYEASAHPESRIESFDNAGVGSDLWRSQTPSKIISLITDWLTKQLL